MRNRVIIIFLIFFISCGERNNYIPDVFVNHEIDLNSPENISLSALGGSLTIENQGYNGLIIYRFSNYEYHAYDKSCTYEPLTACELKEEIENANKTVEELSKLSIVIKSKLQEDGKKLFGSISSKQLVDEIGKQGIQIDRKFVKLSSIKEIGSYTAEIRLHRKVNCSIEFKVVSEKN